MTDLAKLVVRLEAQTAQYQSQLKKARRDTLEFQKSVRADIQNVARAFGTYLGTREIIQFSKAVVDSIANYKGLSEKIGDTAEAVASLKSAADLSDTSFETIGSASVKLTAALSKMDDDTKGAGAAIKALGLDFKAFKDLSPVQQLDAVARAMSQFEEGANKTAVAVALFGKSGAELVPFLNDLADGGERQSHLTNEQIEAVDELTKSYARLLSETGKLAQSYVGELVPVADKVVKVLREVSSEFVNAATGAQRLKEGANLKEWAQSTAIFVAMVGESVVALAKAVRAIGGSFEAVYADIALVSEFVGRGGAVGLAFESNRKALGEALESRNRTVAEANQRYQDLWNYNGTALSDALKREFAGLKSGSEEITRLVQNAVGLREQLFTDEPPPVPFAWGQQPRKPRLNFSGDDDAEAKLKKAGKAAKEAKVEFDVFDEAVEQWRRQQADLARSAEQLALSLRTPIEVYQDQIDWLNLLASKTDGLGRPMLSAETYARALAQANQELADSYRDLEPSIDKTSAALDEFMKEAQRGMQNALSDFLFDPFEDGLRGMALNFARTMQRMAADAAAAQIAQKLFGSGQNGDNGLIGHAMNAVSGLFTGGAGAARAHGGQVSAGQQYLVGERGPELFVPDLSGYIVANDTAAAAQPTTINIHLGGNANSLSPTTLTQLQASIARGLASASRRNN